MVHFLRWSGEIAEDDSAVAGHGWLVSLRRTQRLAILRDHHNMRRVIGTIGGLALASLLDFSRYNGLYTKGLFRMLAEIAVGFGWG